jgi:RNA polymerase sigma-70 factor (sigma-E family)
MELELEDEITATTPPATAGPAPVWRHAVPPVDPSDTIGTFRTIEDVYAAEQTPMLRLATLLCGSTTQAHDVVQDAFANLLVKWDRVDQPGAYLRRSVVNGALGRRRRRGREHLTDRPPTSSDGPGHDRVELADALAALPRRQRAAIVLRFYFGVPDRDIADALECKVGTVASLVHRGLEQLRGQLTDLDEPAPRTPAPRNTEDQP